MLTDYPELEALPADQKMTLAAQLWQEAVKSENEDELYRIQQL